MIDSIDFQRQKNILNSKSINVKSSSTVNSSARELELRAESILNAECFRMDQLPYVFNKHSNLAYLFLRRHMEFNDYVGI